MKEMTVKEAIRDIDCDHYYLYYGAENRPSELIAFNFSKDEVIKQFGEVKVNNVKPEKGFEGYEYVDIILK